MEILTVATLGIITILFLIAFMKMIKTISESFAILEYSLLTKILEQHKKTRKETQEIKTRLTQVRKDLNVIEKAVKDRTITYRVK